MIIPENILQNLLCSDCKKYLSIGPIKAYPNRKVKCGRCSENDDMGVESLLYNAVVKDMMFPCLNISDGCKVVLPLSKMKNHEHKCEGGIYECSLCSDFKGIAYDLKLHCQRCHQKETLQNPEFWIDFGKSSQNEVFFHSKGSHLFFVHYYYDFDLGRLTLDIVFFGKCYKGNLSYSFRLYSIEKELMYKSKSSSASVMEAKLGTTSVVNLAPLKFPKNVAICNFFIHEEPELKYVETIPVIDSSLDTFIIKSTLKNVNHNNFQEKVFSPAVYYFKDIEWRVFIRRKLSLTDYKWKFGVFLMWSPDNEQTVASCKVSATLSVLSSDGEKKISKRFVKREFVTENHFHGVNLADWNYIRDPENGFIHNNSINVEIKMKIYLDCKKEVKCNDCNRECIWCNV